MEAYKVWIDNSGSIASVTQNACRCIAKKGMRACSVTQLCPALCDPMDCSPPGSSVHGICPGKNTGVGCHFLLKGIFLTQRSNLHLLHLLHWQVDSLPLSQWVGREAEDTNEIINNTTEEECLPSPPFHVKQTFWKAFTMSINCYINKKNKFRDIFGQLKFAERWTWKNYHCIFTSFQLIYTLKSPNYKEKVKKNSDSLELTIQKRQISNNICHLMFQKEWKIGEECLLSPQN